MNTGLILAAVIALGAVANLAQDTCNADEVTAAQDKFDAEYKKGVKDVPARKDAIRLAKEFIEKYSTGCTLAEVRLTWLKTNIPVKEKELREYEERLAKELLIKRFNTGLETKNWDEVYSAGKELLSKYPDDFRDVQLVLGTIGFDETYNKKNSKYNDDTLKFAKMAITDLEENKKFSASFGVPKDFVYKSKDNALGWMNLVVGFITQVGQKNKTAAAPYLYKATQTGASETAKNPLSYELIGGYYFDELNKLVDEIKVLEKSQNDTDPEDVAKQKVDAIKAKVAMANGTAERAMDAFSRAYTHGTVAAYKTQMKKNVEDAYRVRFGNVTGVDAWIVGVNAKPFPNPTSPIQPISDPEPVKTTGGTGVGTGNGTGVGTPTGTVTGTSTGTAVGTPKGTATTTTPTTTTPTTTTTTTTTKTAKPKTVVKKPVRKRGAK